MAGIARGLGQTVEYELDPRFVLFPGLQQTGRCEVLLLVIDHFVVDLAQQDQVLIAVNCARGTFAVTRAARRLRCDVRLVADNRIVIARCSFRDENPAAQRASVA
jgi:hypothetical protein